MDDVEDTSRESGLLPQVSKQHGRRRGLLRWLEHKAVSAGDRVGEHPQRHHGREVERSDASDHPKRVPGRMDVDAVSDLLGMLAFDQAWYAAGELEIPQAAQYLALGIGEHLAVLARDRLGYLLRVAAHQIPHGEEDLAPARQRHIAPLRERRGRAGDGGIYVRG